MLQPVARCSRPCLSPSTVRTTERPILEGNACSLDATGRPRPVPTSSPPRRTCRRARAAVGRDPALVRRSLSDTSCRGVRLPQSPGRGRDESTPAAGRCERALASAPRHPPTPSRARAPGRSARAHEPPRERPVDLSQAVAPETPSGHSCRLIGGTLTDPPGTASADPLAEVPEGDFVTPRDTPPGSRGETLGEPPIGASSASVRGPFPAPRQTPPEPSGGGPGTGGVEARSGPAEGPAERRSASCAERLRRDPGEVAGDTSWGYSSRARRTSETTPKRGDRQCRRNRPHRPGRTGGGTFTRTAAGPLRAPPTIRRRRRGRSPWPSRRVRRGRG